MALFIKRLSARLDMSLPKEVTYTLEYNYRSGDYELTLFYKDELFERSSKHYYPNNTELLNELEDIVKDILAYCEDWREYLIESDYEVYMEEKESGEDVTGWEKYLPIFRESGLC